MGSLAGKRVIITGGSGDIGISCARLFLAHGAGVILVGRSIGKLEQAADQLANPACHVFAADVADSDDVIACMDYAADVLGGLDVLLSNAGISGPSLPIESYPEEDFDRLMAVNVTGSWLCLKYAFPLLKQNVHGGSVIITSSGAGLFGLADLSGYVTSKHALTGLMRGAALEGARDNIRVNLVCPGPVKSAMTDAIGADFGMSPEEYEQVVCETIPMGRYASLEEVADLMLFLASDASSYCTGSIFPLDGGKSMH